MTVEWLDVFVVFVLCHLVGDFLLQTDHQAENKRGGLGPDPVARRALASHILTYTLAFVPALIWTSTEIGVGAAAGIAGLIAVPHWIQDDGRLISRFNEGVKGLDAAREPGAALAVDQTFHLLALFGAAALVSALA